MTALLVPVLAALGPLAVVFLAAVVFAETGFLLGFFLPGDSILFAAGLYVATGVVPTNIVLVILVTAVVAVLGDQVAYLIGSRIGPRLFEGQPRHWRSAQWLTRHVDAARVFFDRHGHRAVVLARFLPLARTFTPVVAGAVGMPRRRFTAYNAAGGLLWVASMLLAGFWLGGVPLIAAHVELFTVVIVTVSMAPAAVALIRRRARRGRKPSIVASRLAAS